MKANKPLRIAQVAPLWERVPPQTYGGIENVVSLLTEELVQRGHHVTLFASAESQTSAQLEAVCPHALRQTPLVGEYDYYELLQLSWVYEQQEKFDIIHFHDKCVSLPFSRLIETPTVRTLHYPFTKGNSQLFDNYRQQPYISLSQAQRQPMPQLNYVATVYNSIDLQDYPFYTRSQPPYLAFLGRMSPEKGPQHAIAIARATNLPLKLAGKVGFEDEDFFNQTIQPQIDGNIQYLGELTDSDKVDFLGKAAVTLFPITWDEPFGLVMLESMSTGTPVIGMGLGSVPEVIAHGQTGFVCNGIEDMATRIPAALELDRQTCRDHVANHFSVVQMVNGYEAAYQQVLEDCFTLGDPIHNTQR